MKNVLRWEDLCIVVFDEVYYCIKNYFFNKFLENNYLIRFLGERFKIFGFIVFLVGKKIFFFIVIML